MTPKGSGGRGSGHPGARTSANLWPRRIITGVALLAVLGLLVAGLVHLVGAVTSSATAQSGPAQSGAVQSGDTQSGSARPGGGASDPTDLTDDDGSSPVLISVCTAQDLTAALKLQGSPTVGSGATFGITLEGPSDRQCSTTFGQVTIRVVSGDQTLYDSAECDDRQSGETPLLFTPGQEWSGTLSWDGRTYDGCTPVDTDGDGEAEVAGAGTYRVEAHLDGDTLGEEVVFEVR
ncbi:MAG: hypothetical protein ACTJGR_11045 [Pauljensenia sp.]